MELSPTFKQAQGDQTKSQQVLYQKYTKPVSKQQSRPAGGRASGHGDASYRSSQGSVGQSGNGNSNSNRHHQVIDPKRIHTVSQITNNTDKYMASVNTHGERDGKDGVVQNLKV